MVYDSLSSHFDFPYDPKFDIECVKEYSEMIYLLSKLYDLK